jgi:hypothetical protein
VSEKCKLDSNQWKNTTNDKNEQIEPTSPPIIVVYEGRAEAKRR